MSNKLKATWKLVTGGLQVIGGVKVAFGGGLIGTYCKNHNMMQVAKAYGRTKIEAGLKKLKEAFEELDKS